MDITGKIIFVSEPRSCVSKTSGSQWMTQDFVIETHDQYPRKCVFNVFGEDRLKQFNIQLNGEYTVSFDIDAHEYNGRWFNNIRAWRVVPATAAAQTPDAAFAPAPTATQTTTPAEDIMAGGPQNDDLPF